MKIYIQALFLLFFILSCGRKNSDLSFITVLDSAGYKSYEAHFVSDSILHGVFKSFYQNGKVKEIISYDMGKKNGLHTSYDEDGKVISEVTFENGIRTGVSLEYYQSGCLKAKSFWLNNKQFGDAFFYRQNGFLESYCSFDFEENNRYLIKYDDKGFKIREEGSVLGQLLLDGVFDSIPLGKLVNIKISVATPPGYIPQVIVVDNTKDSGQSLSIKNNIAVYDVSFKKKGLVRLMTLGYLFDSTNNKLIRRDSILTELIVR